MSQPAMPELEGFALSTTYLRSIYDLSTVYLRSAASGPRQRLIEPWRDGTSKRRLASNKNLSSRKRSPRNDWRCSCAYCDLRLVNREGEKGELSLE